MRTITIRRFYPYEIGRRYHDDHYPIHVSDDADVVVDGRVVIRLRKNGIPDHPSWFEFMRDAFATPLLTSRNRKTAMSEEERRRNCRSGILGFFDRLTPQMKKKLGVSKAARPTAFLKRFPREWRRLLPFVRHVDRLYRKTCPEDYRRQEQEIGRVHPALRIGDTVFTTITVNQNWSSGTHTDSGDFTDGMSCLAIIGRDYEGGSLGFPRLGVLLRIRPGDVVLMDSHEPHGNTPIRPTVDGGRRISMVFYLREDMSRFRREWRVDGEAYYLPA